MHKRALERKFQNKNIKIFAKPLDIVTFLFSIKTFKTIMNKKFFILYVCKYKYNFGNIKELIY